MDILTEAVNIAKLLEKADIEWAFVGGVAVGIHGFIRATEDIDIVINQQDLSKLDQLLEKCEFIINKDPITFKDGFMLYRRVKLIGDEYFMLDVMLPPENFSGLLKNRQEGTISGIKVFVAARQDLIKMKKGTGRNKDKIDADELEKINMNPEVE